MYPNAKPSSMCAASTTVIIPMTDTEGQSRADPMETRTVRNDPVTAASPSRATGASACATTMTWARAAPSRATPPRFSRPASQAAHAAHTGAMANRQYAGIELADSQ